MTNEEIKEEFERWIAADRPEVWHKYPGDIDWRLYEYPSWDKEAIYIVDDKYAEVRKAFHDGEQIQYRVKDEWIDCPEGEPRWVLKPEDYRVKPETEPVDEWQWTYRKDDEHYAMTSQYYKDIEEFKESILTTVDCIQKFEPSKRERK